MNPQIRSQYVDIPLTNYSIEKAPADLLGDIIAPVLPVDKDTGIYFEYGQEDFDVSGNDVRSPGAEAGIEGYSLQQKTYGPLNDHSRKVKVPVEHQVNQMAPLDAVRDASRKLIRRAKLYKEADLVAKLTNTSVITQYAAPSVVFDNYANSSLKAAFKVAFDTLMASIQKKREELTVVISYPVWSVLVDHPEIIERFKYSQTGIITPDMLRQFLQVKEVLIGAAVKNTSAESVTPVTNDYIWGKGIWVMYRENTPSLYSMSGLYTLNLPGVAGPWTMYRYWEQKTRSDYVEVSYYYQQYVMAPQAIYYMPNCIT